MHASTSLVALFLSTLISSFAAAAPQPIPSDDGALAARSEPKKFNGNVYEILAGSNHSECKVAWSEDEYVVALPPGHFDQSHCNKQVKVSWGGKTVTATILDKCLDCVGDNLDLTQGAFQALGAGDNGVLQATWWYL